MKEFCESFKEPVKNIIGLEKIMLLLTKKELPKGHSTSNPCQYDVDITSIRRRPSFDEFPRHFHELFRCNFADRKIHVVSTYFFRRNFGGRKIQVVSTYFLRCNFDGRKIRLATTHFFWCNFSRRNIHSVSTYFFQLNFDGRKIHSVYRYFLLTKCRCIRRRFW